MKATNFFCLLIGMMLLLTVFGTAAMAGGSSSGQVLRIIVHTPGVVMFNAGAHSNKPACSRCGDEWAFSLNSPHGRAMYALLLTAADEGIPVGVVGTGGCTAWGDREDVYYIYMDP